MTKVMILGTVDSGKMHLLGLLESIGVDVIEEPLRSDTEELRGYALEFMVREECPEYKVEPLPQHQHGKRGKKGKSKKDWQL